MIQIPSHYECEKGRDGGPCGYCWKLARDKAATATQVNLDEHYARLTLQNNPQLAPGGAGIQDCIVTPEEKIHEAWSPKTDAGARDVPFGFDHRCVLALERFFEKYTQWPLSVQAVNRRVKRAARHAEGIAECELYPHALRSTAATYHAGRGLGIFPLQAMFGWKSIETAQKYVASSSENTARALHMVHLR